VSEVVLIDLSSVAHPIWHTSQADPDMNATSTRTVARIRSLATGHERVAICCDAGRSFRKDIDPAYKAQRPETDAALRHQINTAKETLIADGFPVWSVSGFEADDLLATATKRALDEPETSVLIVSADKDLLQLVGPRVTAKHPMSGNTIDEPGVIEKFGVRPSQIRDYLTLVGDASDNVKGAKGIGPKKAADLLAKFGSLDELYDKLEEAAPADLGIKPSEASSLQEFAPRFETVRSLIELRSDVEIPFNEINAERRPKGADEFGMEEEEMTETTEGSMLAQTLDLLAPAPVPAVTTKVEEHVQADGRTIHRDVQAAPVATPQKPATSPAPSLLSDVLAATPAEWGKQLEPRSMAEARQLAKDIFESRLFSAYGHPAAVLTTILAGRELGLQAMASLRAFHIIEGKPTLAADFIRALVLKSGLAREFRCTERTAEKATFVTQRGDEPPISLTYTLAEGRAAFSGTDQKWASSGWGKSSADQCVARAGAKLARLVYPEVIFGLYAHEEFDGE